jgi:hypothetical protein
MLGSNPGPLQLVIWQSDALTTRLDLIRTRLDLIRTRLDLIRMVIHMICRRKYCLLLVPANCSWLSYDLEQERLPNTFAVNGSWLAYDL